MLFQVQICPLLFVTYFFLLAPCFLGCEDGGLGLTKSHNTPVLFFMLLSWSPCLLLPACSVCMVCVCVHKLTRSSKKIRWVVNNQTHNNTTIITVYASLHHFIGYKWDQPRICKDTRQLQTTPCPALIPIVGEKPEKLFF